jgi:hypothetical protein
MNGVAPPIKAAMILITGRLQPPTPKDLKQLQMLIGNEGLTMKAIINCNSFYCSCEKLFQPHLEGRPLVVLSNNGHLCWRVMDNINFAMRNHPKLIATLGNQGKLKK